MKKGLQFLCCVCAISCMAVTCKKQSTAPPITPPTTPAGDTSLVNTAHLNFLYEPVTFSTGTKAAGIFIYAEAPDYHRVADADEGFTCVDDVARAIQVYLRSSKFSADTEMQNRTFNLIRFILEMQSANGYFYNFLFPALTINTTGGTSINNANWWSWRALYALSEAGPVVRAKDAALADKIDAAKSRLIASIKSDLAPLPQTTKLVSGITIPEWLPAGSGTDQAAILILGLIPSAGGDAVLTSYIKKLADGIAIMQLGDATHFPYSCILSWENTWHAYAADQPYALMKAGVFLNEAGYTAKGIAMVDNFYPWLLQNGIKASFAVQSNGTSITINSEKSFDQIAYGIRPMVSAAIEAYRLTNQEKYADIAGHFGAWLLGANDANRTMYAVGTGRCFDGIQSAAAVNINSGAESTIEALLTMEGIESYPAVKAALNKYKK